MSRLPWARSRQWTTSSRTISRRQSNAHAIRQGAAIARDAQRVAARSNFGIVTLRWIMLHMTTETTRHAGQLDILRELTDGQTGY